PAARHRRVDRGEPPAQGDAEAELLLPGAGRQLGREPAGRHRHRMTPVPWPWPAFGRAGVMTPATARAARVSWVARVSLRAETSLGEERELSPPETARGRTWPAQAQRPVVGHDRDLEVRRHRRSAGDPRDLPVDVGPDLLAVQT